MYCSTRREASWVLADYRLRIQIILFGNGKGTLLCDCCMFGRYSPEKEGLMFAGGDIIDNSSPTRRVMPIRGVIKNFEGSIIFL